MESGQMSTITNFDSWISYYNCDHSTTAARWRTRRNGVGCWVLQCLVCGGELRAISKNAPEVQRMADRVPFDEELSKSITEHIRLSSEHQRQELQAQWQQQEQLRNQNQQQQNREWWEWYNEYLKSPQWERKRRAVLDRCQGICEGCRINKAVQVHHLTYEHVGEEFLWELVAVCRMCHSRIHPHMDN